MYDCSFKSHLANPYLQCIGTVLCVLHVECFDPEVRLGRSNLG